MNKKHSTLKYTLISLFLIACLSIPAMATPDNPMLLNGGIIINGAEAPAGTIIQAKEGNTLLGTTTVQTNGEYGDTAFNIFPVGKPDGTSVDIYVQLPTMSSSVKVASTAWGSDKTFNIGATIDTSSGSSDNTNNGGGGGMGGPATESETPSGAETASTNTEGDTNTNEPTATQSLKDGIEDTVFQTRDAATDNVVLSSILIIGFIAMLLLGYMRYNKT